ncbi:MAG: PIN domain nuclease [Bacteroidetes bacterium QS_8_68_15]|nr:MAG: PIN domain nuclease [Bacteroidetes bacterium QS_8_68_15]
MDTDVVIEILRGNNHVIERRRQTDDRVVTTWTVASEWYYGAAKSSAPRENREAVDDFLGTLDVLEMNAVAARRFGRLKADLELEGQRLADADLLIAAVTLARGAVLVTGNVRHYDRIEALDIEDWIRD